MTSPRRRCTAWTPPAARCAPGAGPSDAVPGAIMLAAVVILRLLAVFVAVAIGHER